MSRDQVESKASAAGVIEAAWQRERPLLVDIASGIVVDRSTAEDVVQEAFHRLSRQDVDAIDNVGAWLTVVVRRLAINHLRSAPSRRESVIDPGLADASMDAPGLAAVDPADRITLDDQVELAMSVVLSRLSPGERTAFILHDVFGLPFSEIAEIVGRTSQACRQLASRARRTLGTTGPDVTVDVDPGAHTELTRRFTAACSSGSLDDLIALLDPSVVGDANVVGGETVGHTEGAEPVARRVLQFFGPESSRTLVPITVDGSPGVLGIADGQPLVVLRLDVADGRIVHGHAYICPRPT